MKRRRFPESALITNYHNVGELQYATEWIGDGESAMDHRANKELADDLSVSTEWSDETDTYAPLEFTSDESCCGQRYRCRCTTPFSSNKRWVLLLLRAFMGWILLGKVCQLADSRDHVHRPRGNSQLALNGGALRIQDFMRRAHSHNDYHQADPLRSALRHGLKSIEVDVFPRQRELWVGHTAFELTASRTIDNLYIKPLLSLIKTPGRTVSNFKNSPFPQSRGVPQLQMSNLPHYKRQQHLMNREANAISLLVDFKGDAEKSVALLREALAPLRPYLSTVDKNGRFQQGKVTVLVSGNRPRDESLRDEQSGERFLFVDGRARDLHTKSDTLLVPMVSIPWRNLHLARLMGRGEQYMHQLVGRAHAQGKVLRVWGAPNREDLWRLMVRSKVDLLSIDDHQKFAQFALTGAFFRQQLN
jgi:hypothetical protein